jgi:nitronate monooxygenase
MNTLTKPLCDLLNIKLPIIQAPMAGVQGSSLAIAVSNAGGLGSLPCAMLTTEQMIKEIETIRAGMSETQAPYNLNFFCHTSPPAHVATAEREAAWRQLLAPFYAQYGIDAASIPAGAGRAPFSEALCDLIAPFKPPVVSFHFGLPEAKLVQRIKSWGGKVLSSATTVAEALWLEQHGADAIIAQGLEAGGHRGMFLLQDAHHKNGQQGKHAGLADAFPRNWRNEIATQQGTFTLLPQIAAAVKLPVIAAGGIVNAASVQAALQLGAAAVQVGTAYMLCPEATTSALHRAALQHAAAHPEAHHTELTTLFTGRPARGISNRLMQELGSINAVTPAFPTATAALAPLRAAAEKAGLPDFSPLWSGCNASGCQALPAADITAQLMHAL